MQPADFIPIAEETGLILPLGEWVLRQSAQRLAHWNTKVVADDPIWMSVNVAARQLTHPGLVEVVKSAIAETGIDAWKLKLEITESMIMADAVAAVGALEQLKALGIHLLMDDFGTGHASLSYLHRLPISTIKIDRYFVGRIDSNSECLEIVRTILNLSRSVYRWMSSPRAWRIRRSAKCCSRSGASTCRVICSRRRWMQMRRRGC